MRNVGFIEGTATRTKSSALRGAVRLRPFIGAFIAMTAMVLTLTWLPARLMASASASARPCPVVQVVFARGTGEPAGVGRVGAAFVDSLRGQVRGKSLAVYAVNYPATRDLARSFDGADDAAAFISDTVTACPDTKIILGGYSQGAAIIDLLTAPAEAFFGLARPMSPEVAPHVAAVAVFGNPSNRIGGGSLTAISELYGYKTIDMCNGGDPVCSSGDDVPAHSLYVESGMASQAARFVAERLVAEPAADITAAGDPTPPHLVDSPPVTVPYQRTWRHHG